LYVFPRIFEDIDAVKAYGWLSEGVKQYQEQLVMIDLGFFGAGVLSLVFVCIYPLLWSYRLLRAEASRYRIGMQSRLRVVSSLAGGYLSILMLFNQYVIIQKKLGAPSFGQPLGGLDLLRLQFQIVAFGVGLGLIVISLWHSTTTMLGARARRIIAGGFLGVPLFFILAVLVLMDNRPMDLAFFSMFVLIIVLTVFSWRYDFSLEAGAKRYRSLSSLLSAVTFCAGAFLMFFLGSYFIVAGVLTLVLAMRHVAAVAFGEGAKQRVEFMLGFYGIKQEKK
jgi:hypothetical protein